MHFYDSPRHGQAKPSANFLPSNRIVGLLKLLEQQKRRQPERRLLLDARIGLSLEPHGDPRIGARTRQVCLDFGRNAA
jgi:hypothetical protein